MEELFTIKFDKDYFVREEILGSPPDIKATVISNPKRKWYQILFEILSFRLYKAPYTYRIKIIDNE